MTLHPRVAYVIELMILVLGSVLFMSLLYVSFLLWFFQKHETFLYVEENNDGYTPPRLERRRRPHDASLVECKPHFDSGLTFNIENVSEKK